MTDWQPHLMELMGDDAGALRQIRRLLMIRRALTGDNLAAPHCAMLVETCKELDGASQVFLLPEIMGLLAVPSPQVQHSVATLLKELLSQHAWLIENLCAITRSAGTLSHDAKGGSARAHLRPILEQLISLVEGEAGDVDLQAPFAAILVLRTPVFAITCLSGLWAWAVRQPDQATLLTEYSAVFDDPQHARVRSRLLEWFVRGPLFLRYLLARWMGQTGISVVADVDASDALLRCYSHDLQPIVASEAICAYAELAKVNDVDRAVRFLVCEARTFRSRQIAWEEGMPVEKALTEVSTGVFHALCIVAIKHFPNPQPIAELLHFILTPPTKQIDLISSQIPDSDKRKVFNTALLLFRDNLTIRVEPVKQGQGNTRMASLGFSGGCVEIDDRIKLLGRSPGIRTFKAIAVSSSTHPNDPMKWRYELTDTWPDNGRGAADLGPLISPSFTLMHTKREPQKQEWMGVAKEVGTRWPWMQGMCEHIAAILVRAMDNGAALTESPWNDLFEYVTDMAATVGRIPVNDKSPTKVQDGCQELRNCLLSLFLRSMARDEVIERVAQGVGSLSRAQLLANLAHTALRSLPESPTYLWIRRALPALQEIGLNTELYFPARCRSLLAVRFHCARMHEPFPAELADCLNGREVDTRRCGTAACFLNTEQFSILKQQVSQTSAKEADSQPYLACERLSRWLEGTEGTGGEEDAAVCLSFLCRQASSVSSYGVGHADTRQEAFLRGDLCLRLLQAYAFRSDPISGNVRRLLDYLLRHCSTAALRFFCDCLPRSDSFRLEILRTLVHLSNRQENGGGFPLGSGLDLQGIRDLLARPTAIQRQLCLMATDMARDTDFYSHYIAVSNPRLGKETRCVVGARGTVLRTEDELLGMLTPNTYGCHASGSPDIAESLGDMVPAFAHCPQPGDSVQCLVRGTPIRPGTIDFHSMVANSESRRLVLEERLRDLRPNEFLHLLGRVVCIVGPGLAQVDLGVASSTKGVCQRSVIAIDGTIREDDAVPVDLRLAPEPWVGFSRWAVCSERPESLPVYDLRGIANAIWLLKQLWERRHSKFLLKGRVGGIHNMDGGACRVFFQTGFKCRWAHGRQEGDPSVVFDGGEPPIAGQEVLLCPEELTFETSQDRGESAGEVSAGARPALREGTFVTGTLFSTSNNGRRSWTARIGPADTGNTLDLPVDRANLTGDFGILYGLDALRDNHRVLDRLKTQPCLLRVIGEDQLSVIHAPARWHAQDMAVAVLSNQAKTLTLLRVEADGGMIFEVLRRGGLADGEAMTLLPSIGLLLRLAEGELFDKKGRPICPDDLLGKEGLRLKVGVKYGRLTENGTYAIDDRGTSFLQADQEDASNLTIRGAFPVGSLCRIQVVRRNPSELCIVDPPFPLQASDIRVCLAPYFDFGDGNEFEAEVSDSWRPASDELILKVRQANSYTLDIALRDKAADIAYWLSLEKGSEVHKRLYTITEGLSYIGGLGFKLDPVEYYLLPNHSMRSERLRAAQGLPLRVTNVREGKRTRDLSVPAETIPFLGEDDQAEGLVVGTPRGHSGSRRISIDWLQGVNTGGRDNSAKEDQVFRLPLEIEQATGAPDVLPDIHPGDVFTACRSGAWVRLTHYRRFFDGTLLYQSKPLDEWARSVPTDKSITATLWCGPGQAGVAWLFAMEPGVLVEVPPDRLSRTELLQGARSLDLVHCEILRTRDGRPLRLAVVKWNEGPLAIWLDKPVQLRFWRHPGTFSFQLTPPEGCQNRGPIEITVDDDDLPSGITRRELSGRDGGSSLVRTLTGYEFEVDRRGNDDDDQDDSIPGRYTYHLRLQFGEVRAKEAIVPRRPSLAEALQQYESGRLKATGRVVAVDGDVAHVSLDHYVHETPLVLTAQEQTRLRQTGPLVCKGWKGQLLVLQSEDGPIASLRQLPPVPLANWLKIRKLTQPHVLVKDKDSALYYWGELSEEEVAQLSLSVEATTGQRWILFEHEPGVSVIARLSQLKFLGEPFDPKVLGRGDIVDRFVVTAASVGEAELGIDIQRVLPDISLEIERFGNKKGIFFGEARLRGEQVSLETLRGAELHPGALSTPRLVRWHPVLEPPNEQQLARLRESTEDKLTVYLRFVRADLERGELVFRILDVPDAFAKGNLVWVRVDFEGGSPVSEFRNGDRSLNVRSLQAFGQKGATGRNNGQRLVIRETLFSIRRGRLRHFPKTGEPRMYLATVYKGTSQSDQDDVQLSLIRNPHRPMQFLLNYRRRIAVVDRLEKDKGRPCVRVQLEEGVFVQMPLARIEGLSTLLPGRRQLRHGDVLVLEITGGRVVAVDLLVSHLDYLNLEVKPTLLTSLWATPVGRRERMAKRKDLQCNLVGLPQLQGYCKVKDEHVECNGYLPQVACSLDGDENPRLEEGVGPGLVVGRLRFEGEGDTVHPVLEEDSGSCHVLCWSAVTFRDGAPEELVASLRNLKWRNLSNEPDETLDRSLVIGRYVEGGISLTALAGSPFPTEHLIEQMPRAEPTGQVPPCRTFVVARAEPEQLVLEIAPGRYAELRTSLLRPLHDGEWAVGLGAEWDRLERGDEVQLEIADSTEERADGFLSAFRIRSVRAGYGRRLRVPFVTILNATPIGPVLGMPGPAAIPAARIGQLLHDQVLDLHNYPTGSARYRSLADHFAKHGSATVLSGRITNAINARDGWLHFVDIGVTVPIRGRASRGDPTLFVAGANAMARGSPCSVRILDLQFSGTDLKAVDYETSPVECRALEAVPLEAVCVRSEGGLVRRYSGLPMVGDSVMVYRPKDVDVSDCRVVGYADCTVEWRNMPNDPLHLHNRQEREQAFSCLLTGPTDAFWATVESINMQTHTLGLSRRVQLEQSLPRPGRVSRARVRAALSDKRLLVQVMEAETVLPADQFCLGGGGRAFNESVHQLAQAFTKHEGSVPTELEVIAKDDGTVSATAVYRCVAGVEEVEAMVDRPTLEGVLAIHQGSRLFVPKKELAWCELDSEGMARLFPPGSRLRVRVPVAPASVPFSFVRTKDVQREIAIVRRLGEESIYVRRVTDNGNGHALVKGQSGVLMELLCEPGKAVPDRCPAYVQSVDELNQVVRLSLDRIPSRLWTFAPTPKGFVLDCATPEVIKSRLAELEDRLANDPRVTTVGLWAGEQDSLEPSPRNLRLTLEIVATRCEPYPVWPSSQEPTVVAFQRAWNEMSAMLCDATKPSEGATAASRFAVGYWYSIHDQPDAALPHLLAAIGDGVIGGHLDVWVCLAHALAHSRPDTLASLQLQLPALTNTIRRWNVSNQSRARGLDVASAVLATAAARVWVEALCTLPLSPIEPADMSLEAAPRWANFVAKGDLNLVRQALQSASCAEPYKARCQAHELWLMIMDERFDDSLDRQTDLFLETLRNEEDHGQTVDARLLLLASQLSFARGDVLVGWEYLNATGRQTTYPELDVARFWRSWLLDTSAIPVDTELTHASVDPLLEELLTVYWRTRWQQAVDAAVVDRLWQAMRKSYHRWVLGTPRFRIVPRPPNHVAGLRERWAERFGVPLALVDLL